MLWAAIMWMRALQGGFVPVLYLVCVNPNVMHCCVGLSRACLAITTSLDKQQRWRTAKSKG